MDQQIYSVFLMTLAVIAGLVIGYEREIRQKPAGIRTHIIVAIGSCIFSLISAQIYPANPLYMSTYVITGIGFLGAGMIIKEGGKYKINGLTTAASVWTTAAIGVAIGYSLFTIAIFGTIITVLAPLIPHAKNLPEIHRE